MAASGGMDIDSISKYAKILILLAFISNKIQLSHSLASKAEIYTTQDFEVIRTNNLYPHFIMFYAPWCGHCKRVQTIWDKFASENHKVRKMKVAKVDCTETTPLCAAENIKGYPTFILYSDQQKYIYRGRRDIPEFESFVNSLTTLKEGQVPLEATGTKKVTEKEDDVPRLPLVLTKDNFNAEIEHGFTFVDFYAPWCSHCNKLEPTWNKLADTLKYNIKVTIAKVDCTADPELCQAHSISGYPTLNLYKDGFLYTSYNQGRSLSNLVSFVQSQVTASDMQDEEIQHQEGKNRDSQQQQQPLQEQPPQEQPPHMPHEESDPLALTVKITEETYKKVMGETPHLIYFHDSGPEFSNMDLLIFEQVQHRLKSLNHDVTVAVIDCSETAIVCTGLGIKQQPSIMYFRSLKDYKQYFGMIDVEKLVEFVVNEQRRDNENKQEL